MKLKPLALLSALSILMAARSSAVVVFSDDFSTDGPLLGTTADIGGTWTITGTSVVNPLTVASTALGLAATGQDAYSPLSTAVTNTAGNGIATTFSLTVGAVQTGGDYFLHLSDPIGTTSNFYSRIYARPSTTAGFYQLGIQSNSGTGNVITYGTSDIAVGQTIAVGLTWTFVAGAANDTFSLTTDGNSYISGYTWTGSAEPTQITAVNVRQGGAGTGPTLVVDNLQVNTIPEPTIAMLGGIGLLTLLRRRR